jgi:hypothetical protein
MKLCPDCRLAQRLANCELCGVSTLAPTTTTAAIMERNDVRHVEVDYTPRAPLWKTRLSPLWRSAAGAMMLVLFGPPLIVAHVLSRLLHRWDDAFFIGATVFAIVFELAIIIHADASSTSSGVSPLRAHASLRATA